MLLVFFLSQAYVFLTSAPRGQPPDEAAHIAYIVDAMRSPVLMPDYSDGEILGSGRKNYLTHPPLYYAGLAAISKGFGWDPVADYIRLRTLNSLLVAAGLLLWMKAMAGFGAPRTWIAVSALATISIPMFPYLAGSINNDNLAYFSAALFFYGFSKLPDRVNPAYWICAAGLVLAFMTKATVAVFLSIFLAASVVLRPRWFAMHLKNRGLWLPFSLFVVVCIAYYLPTLLVHGTPLPAAGNAWSGHKPSGDPMGFASYVAGFFHRFFLYLPRIIAHPHLHPLPDLFKPAVYLMLAIPFLCWLERIFDGPALRSQSLQMAFAIALMITLSINIFASWSGYLEYGVFAGIQPRYYFYALPGLFLLSALGGAGNGISDRILLPVLGLVASVLLAISTPGAISAIHDLARTQSQALPYPRDLSESRKLAGTPVPGTTTAGYLDTITHIGDRIQLRGWAIDSRNRHPARAVWLVFDGYLIGTAVPSHVRDDVAQRISGTARLSGYRIDIVGVPAEVHPCDISVYSEQSDGSLALLRAGSAVTKFCGQ